MKFHGRVVDSCGSLVTSLCPHVAIKGPYLVDKGPLAGMDRYHNFISDTDSDTPFSVSADPEYRSDTADTEFQSDTLPKICFITQYF